MLTCLACLRRAFSCRYPSPSLTDRFPQTFLRRSRLGQGPAHSTWASIKKGHHVREIRKNLKRASRSGKAISAEGATAYSKKISKPVERTLRARAKNNELYETTMSVGSENSLQENVSEEESKKRALHEMKYLQDPFRLAGHVQQLLRHDEVQRAYDLLLTSQKEGSRNIVSWNHIIDYHMHNRKVSDALWYYNQMKKRGTRPDSHTYMIMLRGLAHNYDKQNVTAEAVSIYTSMKASNSTTKPSILHHNAMLNVCNKTGDVDALFGIAGSMPETGPNSPDSWSYSIILSALNSHIHKLKTMYAKEDRQRYAEITRAMQDGRKLWEDIIRRWRAGDVSIDESLVTAMAFLFLSTGREADTKDVLSLVHQTMNIRPPPQIGLLDVLKASERDDTPDPADSSDSSDIQTQVSEPSSGFVNPGNPTLNCLLEAAHQLRSRKIGDWYWNRFHHMPELANKPQLPIQIDFGNYCAYLRLLSLSHASTKAVEVVKSFETESLGKKDGHEIAASAYPFFLAMEACRRDKDSKHAFPNATAIFETMQKTLPEPQPRVLRAYLLIARITTPGLPTYSPPGMLNNRRTRSQIAFDPNPESNHLIEALRRVGPEAVKLRRVVEEAAKAVPDPFKPVAPSKEDQEKTRRGAIRHERIRLLAQDMESDYQRVIAKGVEPALEKEFEAMMSRIKFWLKRWGTLEVGRKLLKNMRPTSSPITSSIRGRGKGMKWMKYGNESDSGLQTQPEPEHEHNNRDAHDVDINEFGYDDARQDEDRATSRPVTAPPAPRGIEALKAATSNHRHSSPASSRQRFSPRHSGREVPNGRPSSRRFDRSDHENTPGRRDRRTPTFTSNRESEKNFDRTFQRNEDEPRRERRSRGKVARAGERYARREERRQEKGRSKRGGRELSAPDHWSQGYDKEASRFGDTKEWVTA
ncbi:MAG: hypothetical protein Q9160_000080 [Pyrenula sp. 1 TL-2023]